MTSNKQQATSNGVMPSPSYAALNPEQRQAVMCYALNVLKKQRNKSLPFATTLELMASSPKMVDKAVCFAAKLRDEREADPELQPWFK